MKKVVILLICLIFMVGCENIENTINYKTISSIATKQIFYK